MKILIFSDVHRDLDALQRVMAQPADLYICAGDLATFGKGLERCGELLAPLSERLWILPGNHETHESTRALCARHGFIDFHRRVLKLGGTHWAGLGYSNVTPFKTPGEYSEEEIAEALLAFDGIEKPYLVVHFPPYNTKLDEFAPGKHAGSPTLRKWVERANPVFLFCGHIHETAGKSEMLGTTKCVNVGKQGYTIEI